MLPSNPGEARDTPGISYPMPNGVLRSWKEIAAYLGKSVRSVQRWERELHLPVHRPGAGVLIAFPEELARWAHRQVDNGNPELRSSQVERMVAARNRLRERTTVLRKNLERVNAERLKAQRAVKPTAGDI